MITNGNKFEFLDLRKIGRANAERLRHQRGPGRQFTSLARGQMIWCAPTRRENGESGRLEPSRSQLSPDSLSTKNDPESESPYTEFSSAGLKRNCSIEETVSRFKTVAPDSSRRL